MTKSATKLVKQRKVRDILSKPSKWIKGQMYESGGKCCLMGGAINRCYKDDKKREKALNRLSKAIGELFNHTGSIINFNDAWNTSFEMIRKVIIRARV